MTVTTIDIDTIDRIRVGEEARSLALAADASPLPIRGRCPPPPGRAIRLARSAHVKVGCIDGSDGLSRVRLGGV